MRTSPEAVQRGDGRIRTTLGARRRLCGLMRGPRRISVMGLVATLVGKRSSAGEVRRIKGDGTRSLEGSGSGDGGCAQSGIG